MEKTLTALLNKRADLLQQLKDERNRLLNSIRWAQIAIARTRQRTDKNYNLMNWQNQKYRQLQMQLFNLDYTIAIATSSCRTRELIETVQLLKKSIGINAFMCNRQIYISK